MSKHPESRDRIDIIRSRQATLPSSPVSGPKNYVAAFLDLLWQLQREQEELLRQLQREHHGVTAASNEEDEFQMGGTTMPTKYIFHAPYHTHTHTPPHP